MNNALRMLALGSVLAIAGCTVAPSARERAEATDQAAIPGTTQYGFEHTIYGSKDVLEPPSHASLMNFLHRENQDSGQGLSAPYALAVNHGRVFVSDLAERQIDVFDISGRRFYAIGATGPGALTKPMGLSADRGGHLFVADGGANTIFSYDEQGNYLQRIGGPQWFNRLTSVAIDAGGQRLYAIDGGDAGTGDPRVRVFDARDGRHLFDFGKRGSGPGEFAMPYDLAINRDGQVYVTDSGNCRIQIFDREGNYLKSFGTPGTSLGRFGRPKAIAIDAAGEVYVADALSGNFQIFNSLGVAQIAIGSHGENGGPLHYLLPSGIAVDEDGKIYFLDQGYRKIDVFRRLR